MYSFSYTVKEELSSMENRPSFITDRDKKYACLYGMLLFCKQFDSDGIVLSTEHKNIVNLFYALVGDVLGRKDAVSVGFTERKNKTKIFTLSVENKIHIQEIIQKYKLADIAQLHHINSDNIGANGFDAFLVGAFLIGGSVIDPNKEYHLEFVTPFSELAEDLRSLLVLIGVTAKHFERRSATTCQQILYIKESEQLEDVLTFMGATMRALEIMNIKILKDVRNKANRIANCDSANIEKIVAASAKQVEDIGYIKQTKGLSELPDELREIAELRLENPELSLRELGEMLEKPIGRSGVNHRMNRLAAIAEELRNVNGGII